MGLAKRFEAFFMAHCAKGYERQIAERKGALLTPLRGTLLEIGPGTGPNLKYFSPGVRWIGLEPNPHMHPHLRREAEHLGFTADLREGVAESTGLPDASVDAVVGTLVLCSIRDPAAVLREALRVLKSGGRYVFIEHVAAPRGTWTRRVQGGIAPLWRAVADGCNPDRETWATIESSGFGRVEIDHFRMDRAMFGPHIAGTAVK